MIKLSIVIPSFNSNRFIARCLNSICNQTYRDFEIIVQDACSDDGTLETLDSFRRFFPGICITIVSEPDGGIYDGMNKGFARAEGEWLYFMGSDDELYHERTLEDVFRFIEGNRGNVVYGNVRISGNTGWADDQAIYDGVYDLEKLFRQNICHQSIFYRRDFLLGIVGKFNTRYRICADWDLNLRCWSKEEMKYCDRIVANFYGGGTSTAICDNCFEAEFLSNVLKYFTLSSFDPLINNPQFRFYEDVLRLQRRENLPRFLLGKTVRYLQSRISRHNDSIIA